MRMRCNVSHRLFQIAGCSCTPLTTLLLIDNFPKELTFTYSITLGKLMLAVSQTKPTVGKRLRLDLDS
jgi:hypothetical protein